MYQKTLWGIVKFIKDIRKLNNEVYLIFLKFSKNWLNSVFIANNEKVTPKQTIINIKIIIRMANNVGRGGGHSHWAKIKVQSTLVK